MRLGISTSDLQINQTELYLCNEAKMKFIYSNLSSKSVYGLVNILNGKIIEVVDEIIKDNILYKKVKFENEVQGWISLEDSVRIYRIPSYMGKCIDLRSINFKHIINKTDKVILNEKIETRYCFYHYDKKGVLVNKLGDRREFQPIFSDSFVKYLIVPGKKTINLPKGTELYSSNEFESYIETIENNQVELIGHYEGLSELEILFEGKKYWIKYLWERDSKDSSELYDLELTDKIIYLQELLRLKSNELRNLNYKINTIKENIVVGNDLQSLFLNKYLGEYDENE